MTPKDGAASASGPPWILGYRGAPRAAPENTLASLRAALGLGLDGLAYDARACASGEVVLLADASLERTSDAIGPLAARTLAELYGVDAGSWHDRRFAGEPLALLEEALTLRGAGGEAPQHWIELREPAALPAVARALESRARRMSVRVASDSRRACVEARDLGLAAAYVVARPTEDARRFVRGEQIAACGVRCGGWSEATLHEEWPCERWALDVAEPSELHAACRAPIHGVTTREPERALAVRALARLAANDARGYPLEADELVVDPAFGLAGEGEWCGRWIVRARVRNPLTIPAEVELAVGVRRGAFEIGPLPGAFELASGAAEDFELSLAGGSWSPGGDPVLRASYVWREGAGARSLALEAPLARVREIVLSPQTRRLQLLRERRGDPAASVTIRRRGRDLLAAIERAGDLDAPRIAVHLDGEVRSGQRGIAVPLPAGFDRRAEGVRFCVGVEGGRRTARGTVRAWRRWAGGLPDAVEGGRAGRLFPGARG
jgi:glycerophosphoryl diester phosphodiesterase